MCSALRADAGGAGGGVEAKAPLELGLGWLEDVTAANTASGSDDELGFSFSFEAS